MTGNNLLFAANTSYQKYNSELRRALIGIAARDDTHVLILSSAQMNEAVYQLGITDEWVLDDTVRGMLALESARYAKSRGIPTVYCDYKSSGDFQKDLDEGTDQSLFKKVDQEGSSAGDAKIQATQEGVRLFNPDIVCWTEAEKVFLVPNFLVLAQDVPANGLLILKRSKNIFIVTYPLDQFLTEQWTNDEVVALMKNRNLHPPEDGLDFMSGARMFYAKSAAAEIMLNNIYKNTLNGHKYFEAYSHLMLPPLIMRKRDVPLPVQSAEVHYFHPAIQTNLEFTGNHKEWYFDKRIQQMIAVYAMCAHELGEPFSTIESFSRRMTERIHENMEDIELIRSMRER